MSDPDLAAFYYTPPDLGTRSGGNDDPGQQLFNKGMNALIENDLSQAIQSFNSIGESEPGFIRSRYFLAHAYYLSGQYTEAELNFNEVSNSPDLRYAEEAEWYALLSCLAHNGVCQSQLDKILDDNNHAFYKNALELQGQRKSGL
jgi:tetratricopeptide (TPR) repeat protein